MKTKAKSRSMASIRAKSIKKPALSKVKRASVAKRLAKVKGSRLVTPGVAAVTTRTSLVGTKIYPATVVPSKRVARVVANLADQTDAA